MLGNYNMLLYCKLCLYNNASRLIKQLNTPLQANFETGITFLNLMEYTAFFHKRFFIHKWFLYYKRNAAFKGTI